MSMKTRKHSEVALIFMLFMVVILNHSTEVYGIGKIPPSPPRRLVAGATVTFVSSWYRCSWMGIDILEDWLKIDADMLQCGTNRTYTETTTVGISQTEENELYAKVGSHLGVKDLAGVSSEISSRTGTSVTLTKEKTVTRSWNFASPRNGELDFAIYQRLIEIRFQYKAGGLFSDEEWTWTLTVPQPEFRTPVSITPQVHEGTQGNRTAWMDFFVSVTFNYAVPAAYENGTSTSQTETLTIIHPANLTQEGKIQPFYWKTQYANFSDTVHAPADLPSCYTDFMLNATSTGVLEHSWGPSHVQPSIPIQLKVRVNSDTGFQPLVLVTDYDDSPIANATVQFDSFFATTDADGVAYFPQVDLAEAKSVSIVAAKTGYLDASLVTLMHPRSLGIFRRLAIIATDPSVVLIARSFTIRGYGFTPNSTVGVVLNPQGVRTKILVNKTVISDVNGNFVTSINLPINHKPYGVDEVIAVDEFGVGAVGNVTVQGPDLNGDGKVDIKDISYVARYFGAVTSSSIPQVISITALATAVPIVAICIRKRKRQKS